MMRPRRILVYAILISAISLSLCLSSCNDSTTIPETTVVLDETTLNCLSGASGNFSTLTFGNITEELSSLSLGDVIVYGVSEATPYGLLRKVTNIVADDNQMTVETISATLEDAIQDCTVDTTWRLQPDGTFYPLEAQEMAVLSVLSVELSDPLASSTEALGTGFYVRLDDVVLFDEDGYPDTKDDQITADLSVEINVDFNIGWTIRGWKLIEAHSRTAVTLMSEVELSCKVAVAEIHPKMEVYRQYLSPFTVMVGPFLPVVILPILSINMGLNGEVSAGITAGVTEDADLTAIVQCSNGDWSTITDFSTSFDWQEPTLTAGCEVKVYAGPQLSFLFYGGAGPYTEVRGYVELNADIFETPWWELYGGLETDVGFKVEAMGHKIADYEKPLAIGYRKLLAQAETRMPVTFPDPNLEEAIREAIGKPTGDIYKSNLLGLTTLHAYQRNIGDITGIEHCINLKRLDLVGNQISDISPLANLANLTAIDIQGNQISDISPLANLTNLTYLHLPDNQISDISTLVNLTNLTNLHISYNPISDISPLANLDSLTMLALNGDQIGDLSFLANLTNVTFLWLVNNKISDISPLANLTNLIYLYLDVNQISDISALIDNTGLGEGDVVYLRDNPLSDDSINIYIPQLEARGVIVDY